MNKKNVVICCALVFVLVIILLLLVPLLMTHYVSFERLEGSVVNSAEQPLDDAKVSVSYLCLNTITFGSGSTGFGKKNTVTGSGGTFSFDALAPQRISRLWHLVDSCFKFITVSKEGYYDPEFCPEPNTEHFLKCAFNTRNEVTVRVIPQQTNLSPVVLYEIQNYRDLVGPCQEFKLACAQQPLLKNAVANKDVPACHTLPYWDMPLCITEIALAQKDPSVCNAISFRQDSPEYAESDTQDGRARCLSVLSERES